MAIMPLILGSTRTIGRHLAMVAVAATVLAMASGATHAQTYGFATLPPGTLNHTTATAVAQVLKARAGMNMLVQPTAGDNVIIPMVARGEAEIGIANTMEVHDGFERGMKDLRLIGAAHALRTPFFVRKDSGMHTIADLRGKRVTMGFSAMRAIEPATRAQLASAGLTEKDIKPVLVPNVVRSADDFLAGSADMFFFAFGAPKVREVDASVGGIRVLSIDENGMPAARKVLRWGYLTEVSPGPAFVGVEKPMKVYSFDNLLLTNAKVPDEMIYRVLTTLEKHHGELIKIQPVLREFTPKMAYKAYDVPYHPGAVKFFEERGLKPTPLP